MRSVAAPIALFLVALAARAVAAAAIRFPTPEDSAYYVLVARNVATGRGLVTDVLWSYATPPLEVPRPAFDLWQPLASLAAAPFMAVFGPSLASAQVSSVILGALAAPFAWAIARDAAAELGLARAHRAGIALAAGLALAFTPVLIVQGAEPDSAAPFTVLALAGCWLVPRALAEGPPQLRWRLLLGLALGLAYLARQEAVYVGVAYLALAWAAGRLAGLRRTTPALAVAAFVAAPWILRQAMTWPGAGLSQVLENAWLVRPADIFAWSERPTLASHLALGLPGLVELRVEALLSNAELLMVLGFPIGLLGLATLVAWPGILVTSALRPLAIAGLLLAGIDSLVFPVASRAGLFLHGSGLVLGLLAVAAALGAQRLVNGFARLRRWRREEGLLAPALLLVLALPVAFLVGSLEQRRSTQLGNSYGVLAAAAADWDLPPARPIVSDHPMWASLALERAALALPPGDPSVAASLAQSFGAAGVIVEGDRATLIAALTEYRDAGGAACFRIIPAPDAFAVFAFTCPATTGMPGSPPILAGA